MRTANRQHPGSRRTLNQVLLAELSCLRPGLVLERGVKDSDREPLNAATFDESDAARASNLRDIYGCLGSLTDTRADGRDGCSHLSALCLSGGGIRSATFNLGVLQALARVGLLGKFDYLSSVSGGGYIAAWLRAWMHRKGVQQVVDDLGGRVKDAPSSLSEPLPVSNLRDYSNYLTPELGLFSGDTWSVAATICRNLLLNWLVLLPLLGIVIGIPFLFLLFIRTHPSLSASKWLLGLAVLVEVIASLLIYKSRRFAKNPGIPQGYFVGRCVLPVCLAAAALSAAAVGLQPTIENLEALWGFAVTWSIGVPVLGWGINEAFARMFPTAKRRVAGTQDAAPRAEPHGVDCVRQVSPGLEVIALILSGMIGAALFVGVVTWWFSFLCNHPALYVVLVFPLSLSVYLISRVVFVGITSLNDERGDRTSTPTKSDLSEGIPDTSGSQLMSRISRDDSDREWWSRLSGWVLLVIVCWTTTTGICLIGCYLPNMFGIATYIVKGGVTLIGLVSGAVAAFTASSSQSAAPHGVPKVSSPAVRRVLAITAPLFLVTLIMILSWGMKGLAGLTIAPDLLALRFDVPGSMQPVPIAGTIQFAALLGVMALVALLAGRIANVNRFSLHGIYRNRLVRAYLGASNCGIDGRDTRAADPFTGFSLSDNLPLHRLCSPPEKRETARGGRDGVVEGRKSATQAPITKVPVARSNDMPVALALDIERPVSIINTTLNLVHGEKLAWQQRKAESFSMTSLFCGNRTEGYRDSREYGGPGGITAGTAITISGAAANPSMGYSSSPVLGFLMAIFNLRLGAWLGNTNEKGNHTFANPGPRHAAISLFAEMFGLTNSNRRYVNLSDGGHFDNLGLYEVVLRRCRHVLVSDAGQDGSFSFEDLGNSIRKIRIDFGINITFDKIQIFPNTEEKEGLCCAIGRIHYSDVDDTSPDENGLLIYIKPTLRGRGAQVPYDIYSYSRENVTFPHESTVKQWFSESQFESYRALGLHIVTQLAEGLGNRADVDFNEFHSSVRDYMTGRTNQQMFPPCPDPRGVPTSTGPVASPDPRISGQAA